MKPSLQLKLSQQLTLTPQLQQSIKLLQLSTLELNEEIERALLENPLLEREDDGAEAPDGANGADSGERNSTATDTAAATENTPEPAAERPDSDDGPADNLPEYDLDVPEDWSLGASAPGPASGDDDETDFQELHAAHGSLVEHLAQQVALMPLTDRDRALVRLVIESLDEDGYLTLEPDELFALLPEDMGFEPEEIMIALHHVQHLDPTGVGARNLGECLALQLRTLPDEPIRALALHLVDGHLNLLGDRNYAALRKVLGCEDDQLRAVQALIRSLNPRPGARYSGAATRYVTPDVVVRKLRGQWIASLNQDAIPRLRINALYAQILQQNRGQNGDLGGQLQEARWMIKNVQQRFDTILRVSQAIVDQQRQFFDHGEVAMRPLTLREIADELGLHESTISRVTTQKYMSTPRGVFELKYFFGSHVATDTGGAASSTAIRALIRQLVDAENRKKPLSDSKIAELLGQQGIVVARRTIAKYRESLGIPAVSQRKSL